MSGTRANKFCEKELQFFFFFSEIGKCDFCYPFWLFTLNFLITHLRATSHYYFLATQNLQERDFLAENFFYLIGLFRRAHKRTQSWLNKNISY